MNFIFVSICIIKKKDQILITKRPSQKLFGEFWEFPGGKLENTETFEEAMARELYEEIGIRINIIYLKSLDILNHSYDK